MWFGIVRLPQLYIMGVSLLHGLEEFLQLFGEVTIADLVVIVFACVFLIIIYKKIRDYLIKKHDIEQEKHAQLQEVLESTRHYPEYRQQSIRVQELLEKEIQELRVMQADFSKRLIAIEEQNKKKERNKLRDLLLTNYRHYTNKEQNPHQTWTAMEAEAFWALFHDYEDAGGNGYIHTVVQPEMERLMIVELGE